MEAKHNIDLKTWGTFFLFSSLVANVNFLIEMFSSDKYFLHELFEVLFIYVVGTGIYFLILGIGHLFSVAVFWVTSDWVNLVRYGLNKKFDHEKRRSDNVKFIERIMMGDLAFPIIVLCSFQFSVALFLTKKSLFDFASILANL